MRHDPNQAHWRDIDRRQWRTFWICLDAGFVIPFVAIPAGWAISELITWLVTFIFKA